MTSLAQTAEAPPGAPPDAGRALADEPCAPDTAPDPVARDDRETMLAEQMAACHSVVLDCLGRAERAGEAEAARHGELRLAARFMTLFLRQSGALDRHRDHLRRAREAEEKAGRQRLGRQVTLAAAQGRGFAQGLEDSLRRLEQAERERRAGPEAQAAPGDLADPVDPAAYSATDNIEGWLETFAAPQRRAEAPAAEAPDAPPPKITRQQRRAAERAERRARARAAARPAKAD